MKDAVGYLLREAWKDKGNEVCVHPEWSQERSFGGVLTGGRICTTCGLVKHLDDGYKAVRSMQARDRQATPPFRIQFRTRNSSGAALEGTGAMRDLSSQGCRFEASTNLHPGWELELRIYAPNVDWPLMIPEASVQWETGHVYGLSFLKISENEQKRLNQVIAALNDEGGVEEESSTFLTA